MQGRREIYEEEKEEKREETDDSLIYIGMRDGGTEKAVFAKLFGRALIVAIGHCPVCKQRGKLVAIPRTPYFQCLACGAVCEEREIVRESIRRWWV